MSYILDALRKSDEQRRRGTTPTLLTPQAATVSPPRRKSLSYGLLGGALLVAGVVIGSLRPWQSAQRAPEPVPLATPPATPAPPAPVVATAPADQAKAPIAPVQKAPPAPRPAVAPTPAARSPEKVDAEAQAETKARPRRSQRETAAPAAKSPPKPPVSRAADSRPASAPPEQPIVKFSELPVEVQLEIPKLQITVHAYSPVPRERLVGINDAVLREGASVSADLKLEQITPDGMVMTYKGYRFRRGVR